METVICSGGSRVRNRSGTSTAVAVSWTTTSMSHWPSMERLVPCPVQVPPALRARLRLEATFGLLGSENSSRTLRAGRGLFASYRST